MKLTFITDEATQQPSEFIALAQQFALDSVELRTVSGKHVSKFDEQEQRQLSTQLEDAGLGVCCIGSPVFKCDLDASLDDEMEKLRRALHAANYLGAPLVRIFTFWRRDNRELYLDRVRESLDRAGEVAKPTGIGLTIENGKRTMHSTGAELAELMRELDPKIFSVLWDPGNSIYGRTDPDPISNGYPLVADYVKHVHIKDPEVYSDGQRRYVELGKGQLDLRKQMNALHEHSYGGYISLETHWRPARVMSENELDYPGGESFSDSGYAATAKSLARLQDFLPQDAAT